jgi:uncharacterized protein YndB with AHSA1/START domain
MATAPVASDREIVSSRDFDAPPAELFAAWADPTRLARWFGPAGFTNTFHEFEFRTGGRWRFDMYGPDGKVYANETVFHEVVPNERITYEHVSNPHFYMYVTFEDLGGQTRMVWRMQFDSAAACDNLKPVCVPSNEQNFDRLEEELARGS